MFFTYFPIPDEEKPAGARRPQAAPRDGPRRVVAARNARRAAGVIKMLMRVNKGWDITGLMLHYPPTHPKFFGDFDIF